MARSSRDYIDILVRMIDAARFQKDAEKSAAAVKDIGTKAEQTGKKSSTSLKSLAKWAASAYIFKRAASYLHGAVEETTSLAKSSLQLQRLTGLDIKTSSEWITVAKTRGIEANRLSVMFTQLGRTQQRALAGSKAQRLAFQQVGISVRQLRDLNTTQLVERISDAFAAMPDGLQKAALAQQFFGRTGRQLLPLLNEGSVSLQESLDMVEKYGAALEGKTAEDVRQMIKRQRELTIAQMGFKEQLSDALIPTLTALSAVLRNVLQFSRPLLKNQTAMRVVLISLAAAWAIYTAATIAATIATIGFRTILMTTGIGLLLVGLGLLIVKWDSVRAVIDRVWMKIQDLWSWIKANWPLIAAFLIGPFAPLLSIVIPAIIRSGDTIKSLFHDVVKIVEWAVGKIEAAAHKVSGPLSRVLDIASRVPGGEGIGLGLALAGHRAYGGPVHRSGNYLVGERGPEVVSVPAGADVTPVQAPTDMPAAEPRVFHIQPSDIYLDGKKVGRTLARTWMDEGAWR